jgi:carboxyl-terminal processing protease
MKFANKSSSITNSMTNKKVQVWLPLLFSITMIAGMFIGYRIKENMPGKGFFYMERKRPVQEVINLIESKYVDEIQTDSLADKAIETILSQLDPHSVFISAVELQEIKEELEGKFYGIGVEYKILSDTINILNVLKDGPSYKAGLQPGDQILQVGDSIVAGVNINTERIRKFLRGGGGTRIDLKVLSNGQIKKVTVTRGMIPLYSLDAAYMIGDTVAYIRLNKFSETTYKEFMEATEKLKKQGMRSMILDLRDNGGGVLTEATEIADEFLSGDKLITYTEGKHSPKKEYKCKRDGIFEKGKLVVLANDGTASASEVLIGALQDWDRAIIIGRRTFGKGLVQEQYELSDGSGVRLTVARYYTPLGRSIQKSYSEGIQAYKDELSQRFHDGEVLFADSIKHTNEKAYKTKNGKTVYGGGGITPDVFVAIDTFNLSKEISKALLKGTINNFVYKNYIANRNQFSKYKSPTDFEKNYTVDENTWEKLNDYAKKDSINFTSLGTKEKNALSRQIKILTARQIWRNEGLFEVSNAQDELVKKALEVLKN